MKTEKENLRGDDDAHKVSWKDVEQSTSWAKRSQIENNAEGSVVLREKLVMWAGYV